MTKERNIMGGTDCTVCRDCMSMHNLVNEKGSWSAKEAAKIVGFRCYAMNKSESAPMKKDFAQGRHSPPLIAPKWCPNRGRRNDGKT